MLDATAYTSRLPPVKDIDAHKLSRRLKKGLSPTFRALLANDLTTGKVWVHHLTRRQALTLTGASAGYLSTVRKIGETERAGVGSGLVSLALLHNNKKVPADAVLDALVAEFGADRLMAALDRATAPNNM